MVDDVAIVGYNARLESLDGEGEDVRDHEGVGGDRVGTAEEEAHHLDGVAPLLHALLDARMTVCHLYFREKAMVDSAMYQKLHSVVSSAVVGERTRGGDVKNDVEKSWQRRNNKI